MAPHGPLRVGDKAPDFTLPGPGDKPVRLSDLYREKTVVLYFYPKDETSVCTIEACRFRDAHADFVAAGAEIVGVSRDDLASHARFVERHKLPFMLLSDPIGDVHEAYGVGRSFAGLLGDRLSFVIDRGGVIRLVVSSPLRAKVHVMQTLAAVQAEAEKAPPAENVR